MTRTILIYGFCLAAFVILLKMVEYQYFIHDLSLEFYVGVLAIAFTGLGVWAGLRLTKKRVIVGDANFTLNRSGIDRMGISARELEILELISKGMSNQEIADRLFVSIHTVKTHASNLFLKLDVKRRTQAIQKAKELQFIP